ncbi:MAG: DUF86 domain-containing protein [Bacteroidetes bacterium]|nr:DUF86 domain-containing protein [Bacteroidota bacterium]
MSRREPELLLGDIIESIQKIKSYTNGMSSKEFFEDDKTLDAVIRNFEIIGEAANRMPEEIRVNFNDVNWHRIRGFRNRIVHDYMGIDYEIVWEIIVNDLEELQQQIQHILGSI